MSWYDNGMPVINDPDVLGTAELIRRLYEDYHQYAGGPLHVILEDGNTGDEHVHDSDYYHATGGRTVETYLCRHRMERGPGTTWNCVYDDDLAYPPEVADLCRLILASFRRMPEPWRAAAIAWADGTIAQNLPILVDNPEAACKASPEQVADLVAELRLEIARGDAPPEPKPCIAVPCPSFTDADRHTFTGTIHPGPGAVFAPDARLTGPFDSYSINPDGSATLAGLWAELLHPGAVAYARQQAASQRWLANPDWDPEAASLIVGVPEGVQIEQLDAAIKLCQQAGLFPGTPAGVVYIPAGATPPGTEED